MTMPEIASRKTWLKARKALLKREKALMKQQDELAAARRKLPLVKVEEDYRFHTARGEKTLAELFGPHRQLIVNHFMFGADWEQGCPSCSFWADNFNGLDAHLAARDTSFVCVSNAPLEKLEAYRKRLGWSFPWVSAAGSRFGEDFGVTFPGDAVKSGDYNFGGKPQGEEMHGLSVFMRLDDGTIGHSYSTYGRGVEAFNAAYHLLDLTPRGRDEDGLRFTMAWVRRRDQYEQNVS